MATTAWRTWLGVYDAEAPFAAMVGDRDQAGRRTGYGVRILVERRGRLKGEVKNSSTPYSCRGTNWDRGCPVT